MLIRPSFISGCFAVALLALSVGAGAQSSDVETVSQRARDVEFSKVAEVGPVNLENIFRAGDTKSFDLYRNGVFARHGYLFKRPDLQAIFKAFSWYKGDTSDQQVVHSRLSKQELRNIEWLEANEFISTRMDEACSADNSKVSPLLTGKPLGEVRVSAAIGGNYRLTLRSADEKVTKSPDGISAENVYSGHFTLSVWRLSNNRNPSASIDLGDIEIDSGLPLTVIDWKGATVVCIWHWDRKDGNVDCDPYLFNAGVLSRLAFIRDGMAVSREQGLRADRALVGLPVQFRSLIWCSFDGSETSGRVQSTVVERWNLNIATKTIRLVGSTKVSDFED